MRTMPRPPRRRNSTDEKWAAVILAFLAMPVTTVVYGETLAKLWEWFVAGTFHLVRLSVAQAVGLSMVVTFVTYQYDARKDEDDDRPLENMLALILTGLIRAAIALLFGLIIKQFV